MELFATCSFGLEKLVYKELKQLGLWVLKTEDGRVTFEGTPIDILRSNLWLRTAGRVHLKMGEGEFLSFDELFDYVHQLPWEQYIGPNDAFPIHASSAKSTLHSESALQSIVKKAIVNRLTQAHGTQVLSESSGVRYHVWIHINKDYCIISIDSSGESLHKRGFRPKANLAPLRETLAAAMVLLSDWTPERTLLDPFCGSGTILIEAGLIATNTAPGAAREFPCTKWPIIPQADQQKARQEVQDLRTTPKNLKLLGYDKDSRIIPVAQDNARLAGMDSYCSFRSLAMEQINFNHLSQTTIITNPPYGERLEDRPAVEQLYTTLGSKWRQSTDTSLYLITSVEDFPRLFGSKPAKNRKLFNGTLRTYLFSYPAPPSTATTQR